MQIFEIFPKHCELRWIIHFVQAQFQATVYLNTNSMYTYRISLLKSFGQLVS